MNEAFRELGMKQNQKKTRMKIRLLSEVSQDTKSLDSSSTDSY